MALYRTISMSFWTDRKVVDDFTPEDRYFYLYLFTNPHTNLCGCYEISTRQMVWETGYSEDSIKNLLKRFENVHDVIRYSAESKELLLMNWSKYNWTKSEKFRKPLLKEIASVKDESFKDYLSRRADGEEIRYGIDTTCIGTNCSDTSVTNTVSNTNTDSNTEIKVKNTVNSKKLKSIKNSYGEYKNVKLTDEEYARLEKDYGIRIRDECITFLDEYIEEKGYRSKSHNLAIRRWVANAVIEKQRKKPYKLSSGAETNNPFLADYDEMVGGTA